MASARCSLDVRHTRGTNSCYLLRGRREDLVLTRICTKREYGACRARIHVTIRAILSYSCHARADQAGLLTATLTATHCPVCFHECTKKSIFRLVLNGNLK